MKLSDWKLVGQMQAFYIRLHGLVVETFRAAKIGPEVLEWLDGPGNEFFGLKLVEIAEEYKRQTTPVILRAEIDLDADPTLPFDGATVKEHLKEGTAVIEKRADGVYLNGKKLVLRRSERQTSGERVTGIEMCFEIKRQQWDVHNATLLDFFVKNPQFWPDDCKRDVDGNTIYVYFWGSKFLLQSFARVCVRCGYWDGEAVVLRYNYLGNFWNAQATAVVSESNKETLLG